MKPLVDYFRCPEEYVAFDACSALSSSDEFFPFGSDIVCYGKHMEGSALSVADYGADGSADTVVSGKKILLPFDPAQVIDNLRLERYVGCKCDNAHFLSSPLARAYYFVRPFLSIPVRKHVQRLFLRDWSKLQFPNWPVDTTVDKIFHKLVALSLRSRGVNDMPFIWFWPEGASAGVIMTHDVETKAGRDYCASLMDIDERFGVRSSFQIVPELRYEVPADFLRSIRDRGFEINVQDLNHDGLLYRSRDEFLRRVGKINQYGKSYGALGFRSAALYRRQEWYDALDFEYDMSVPNVAHLDPQRGGCCTVMPYFVGNILELPVTTIQDYSLFHVLNTYSLDLWRKQIDIITTHHGLISFIVHPDYVVKGRSLKAYQELLSCLAVLRSDKHLWIASPGEVNRWWRQRAQMKLVKDGDSWRITGEGGERACVAYASAQSGSIRFALSRRAAQAADNGPAGFALQPV